MKNKRTKLLFLILSVLILFLAIIEINNIIKPKKNVVVQASTKMIGIYQVSSKQTDYQIKIEPLLNAALKANDEKEIINNVSKYFASDYFTLKNKQSSTNVGGLGFVLADNKSQFKTNAIDSYYRDVSQYEIKYGKDNMPLVENVIIDSLNTVKNNIVVLDKNAKLSIKKTFKVAVSFSYVANEKLSNITLVNRAYLIVVQASDNNYYVYEIEGEK